MTKPPEGLPPTHPAWVLGTWFGTGLIPKIPGTLASLSALPFAWIIQANLGAAGLVLAAAIAFAAGTWACRLLVAADKVDDPGHIVIDEVAGQWLTLVPFAWLAGAPDPLFYATGFALFRLFDIVKPWPIDRAERLNGAAGVMADDFLAAVYAGAGTAFIFAYTHHLGPFSP